MEHIDAAKLNSDIRYRFDYVSKVVGFTKADIGALNAIAGKMTPAVPTVVDAVYAKLFSFDINKSVFATHNVKFTGAAVKSPGSLDLTPERITFLKDSLGNYLKKILTQADWDNGFLEYLSNLGKVHANKADSKNINVAYVHMNAALGLAAHLLLEAVLTGNMGFDDKTKKAAVAALNKFVWIQNDLFTMHYVPH